MSKDCKKESCPWWNNEQMYNMCPYLLWADNKSTKRNQDDNYIILKDYGPDPFTVNIHEATDQNTNFRTALWTGNKLQLTLMSIPIGESIGLEVHPNVDQFIRIEDGKGVVKMGNTQDNLNYQREINSDYALFIPAGKWHNIINTGNEPLKLYTIYAPPQHPYGTVHKTKADAQSVEQD